MRTERLTAAIRPFLDAGVAPGAVVGLRERGEVTLEAQGTIAPGSESRLLADAQVRISSNTKPLVAATALVLAEDGLLSLDDPVERFVPELADRRVLRRVDGPLGDTEPARRPVTVEDLLTMRLGFGWVFESACPAVDRAKELGLGFGPPDPQAVPPPDEWVARFAQLPLLEQPGSVWRYELAFALLGIVVARAAGRSLEATLDERLLSPLGMADTAFVADPERLVPALARSEDGLVPFDGVADSRWASPPSFADGRGGLVSTAGDLLRFAGMLLERGGGLLTPSSATAMTTDRLTSGQREGPSAAAFLDSGGWGYGVGVVESPAGRRYGWGGGLGTLWYSWPDHDLAAVLVTQVLPPSPEMFNAFTAAAESELDGSAA